MKKVSVFFLTLILFLSLLIPASVVGTSNVEDLTTFTEVDAGNKLSETASRVTITNMVSDSSNTYLYKDKGVDGISGDFIYDFTWNMSLAQQGASYHIPIAVSNANDGFTANEFDAGDIYVMMTHFNDPNEMRVLLYSDNGSYISSATGYINVSTSTYYARFQRIGSTAYLNIYTNPDHSTQTGSTLSLAVSSVAYRYLYATSSFNTSGGGKLLSGYVENITRIDNPPATGLYVSTDGNAYNIITNAQDVQGSIDLASSNATEVGFQLATSTGVYTSNVSESGDFGIGNFSNNFTSLTVNTTYFYRAFALGVSGYAYGLEHSFVFYSAPVITTDSAVVSTYSDQWKLTGTVVDKGTTGTIIRSFFIGRTSGVWESNIGIQSSSSNYTGQFIEVATVLLPNTTYYYQAYAYKVIDLYTFLYGYGSIESFNTGNVTTPGLAPQVSTVSAIYNSNNLTYTLNGMVTFSVLPIVQRGFNYGYATNMTANISQSGVYGSGGSWGMNLPVWTVPGVFDHLYQAWAKDSSGAIGYGSILIAAPTVAAGATVSMVSATAGASIIDTTHMALVGRLDTIGFIAPTLRGFAWNTVDNITGAEVWFEAINPPVVVGQFAHEELSLVHDTTYYFYAGVYANGTWVWSTPITATTGHLATTISAPVVTTNLDPPRTGSSINASLTITRIAGLQTFPTVYINEYGFNVGTTSGVYTEQKVQAGNFDIGSYWVQLSNSSWESGDIIYIQAYAHNNLGKDAVGAEVAVVLSGTGVIVPAPGGVAKDFSAWILGLARAQGMDNTFGRWGFMFEIMVGLALIFGIFIVALAFKHESLAAKIIAYLLAVIEVITLGAFLFTGWLGIWPVIIMVVIFVAIIALYIKTKVGATGVG
jgi:hypothetical protein